MILFLQEKPAEDSDKTLEAKEALQKEEPKA